MQVYAKLGFFGLKYYKDNGLFVERISKKEYDKITEKSERIKLEKKIRKELSNGTKNQLQIHIFNNKE